MHHFAKQTPKPQYSYWDEEMTQKERLDMKQAFAALEKENMVAKGLD